MSFTQSVYHIVFGTKRHKPVIRETFEHEVYKILYDLMASQGAHVYRIGGMPDHVHILADIGARNSLSDFVKKTKQESSFLIARHTNLKIWEGWEAGYAAFSYSSKEIKPVTQYIINQKEHHKKIPFIDEYRAWLIEMGISPDVPYFPKTTDDPKI